VYLLSCHASPPATGGYAQRLHADGSSTLHHLHDVAAAAVSSCAGSSGSAACVGPDHPEYGGPLFEALVSSINQPGASSRFKCGTLRVATGAAGTSTCCSVPVWLLW
jgi:hypothetical protein